MLLCVLVVPSRPQSATVTEVLPTMVRLYVEPPEQDGGMPLTDYIVSYENESVTFTIGLFMLIAPLLFHANAVVTCRINSFSAFVNVRLKYIRLKLF